MSLILAIITGLAISTCLIFLTASNFVSGQVNQTSSQTFENTTEGLRLQFPVDWEVGENSSHISIWLTSEDLVSVRIIKTPEGTDLKQIAENYGALNGDQILQSKPVTINNKPGHLVLSTYEDTVYEVAQRVMTMSVKDDVNNRFIVFTYQAPLSEYDAFLSTAGNIIKSTQFTNMDRNSFSNDFSNITGNSSTGNMTLESEIFK